MVKSGGWGGEEEVTQTWAIRILRFKEVKPSVTSMSLPGVGSENKYFYET